MFLLSDCTWPRSLVAWVFFWRFFFVWLDLSSTFKYFLLHKISFGKIPLWKSACHVFQLPEQQLWNGIRCTALCGACLSLYPTTSWTRAVSWLDWSLIGRTPLHCQSTRVTSPPHCGPMQPWFPNASHVHSLFTVIGPTCAHAER